MVPYRGPHYEYSPRGGVVLSVEVHPHNRDKSIIWTINTETLEERAIIVWTLKEMPVQGDVVMWHPYHSPGWRRRGEAIRAGWLPRVGLSWDPVEEHRWA